MVTISFVSACICPFSSLVTIRIIYPCLPPAVPPRRKAMRFVSTTASKPYLTRQSHFAAASFCLTNQSPWNRFHFNRNETKQFNTKRNMQMAEYRSQRGVI
jgi:hypothetical protein